MNQHQNLLNINTQTYTYLDLMEARRNLGIDTNYMGFDRRYDSVCSTLLWIH